MYLVQKNSETVRLLNKESADELLLLLMTKGDSGNMSKRHIIGANVSETVFIVTAGDTQMKVVGQADSEMVIHWLLSLIDDEIAIERSTENA